jgi:hypothetical protein
VDWPVFGAYEARSIRAVAGWETARRPTRSYFTSQVGLGMTEEISELRLAQALQAMAEIVVKFPQYLPLFERLEFELSASRTRTAALQRARAIASAKS